MELDINSCRELLSITRNFNYAIQEYGGFGAMHLFVYVYVCTQHCLGNFLA